MAVPRIILASVVVDLAAPAVYITVLNKASIWKWAVHIVKLVIVDFNRRSLINMYPGFCISYVTIVNSNVGTVVEHNTKAGCICHPAIGDMYITAIVKSNTIGSVTN